jgi:YfiH family protein
MSPSAKPRTSRHARFEIENPEIKGMPVGRPANTPGGDPPVLQAANLRRIPWLKHGFSTRLGGVSSCYHERTLNLGFTKEDLRDCVQENRRRFLTALGAATGTEPWPLVTNRQIHSDVVHVVQSSAPDPLSGDGLITNVPGLAIAILTADCFPVLLTDKKNRVVGAFHAGWRGTVKRIVEKGVGIMRHEFGSLPQDIHAVIGPGIQRCCYEVGEELKSEFDSQFTYANDLFHEVRDSDPVRQKYPLLFLNARPPGHGDLCIKLHLDLQEANRRQLLAAGVPRRQITAFTDCTSCNTQQFFSHRSERGYTGRMLAVMAVAPECGS